MRLNPRNIKRMMFACVQCGQCLTACDTTQTAQGRTPTLEWKVGLDAVRETLRQRRCGLDGRTAMELTGARFFVQHEKGFHDHRSH